MKAVRGIGKAQQRKLLSQAAMPDVREIIKKHGISVVSGCLSRLREYEKKARKAEELREQAEKLERELEGDKPRVKSA